ncbi:polysaccharide biosynthesis/export family protein [Opitutus sp. ER46]|uniref:polysaccharide biosynthesis/export family protein n=1 Tax=Opitutus sp. ER46 TaxID=2161864 RepID=UPI001304FFDE|nr:polysaccharide biosynthesis/export family protein [Opitutus sp. ER46]
MALVALNAAAMGQAASAPETAPAPRLDDKKVIPYRITRGDRLAVSIFGEPDLTAGNKRVEGNGTINLTLVGYVRVYGLTLAEAADAIEAAYRDGRILRNPEVTVMVEEYSPRVVTVSGKVKFPGRVDLPPEQQWTIKDVITKVGGFDDTARGTAVRLIRKQPDGSSKVYTLDVQSTLLGKDRASTSTDASFPVEPDDTIYVPEKII